MQHEEDMTGVNTTSPISDMGAMRIGRIGRIGRMGQPENMWAYRTGLVTNSIPNLSPSMDPFIMMSVFSNDPATLASLDNNVIHNESKPLVEIMDSFKESEPI